MATSHVSGESDIAAPAETVYACLANYREHHPRILPPAFSNFRVEQGGIGAGTVISFKVKAGGRTKSFRQTAAEPEPGRVLTESDENTVTTFTVTPIATGSHVRIESAWQPRGLMGVFERLFAPSMLRKLYADELQRLDAYAREQAAGSQATSTTNG